MLVQAIAETATAWLKEEAVVSRDKAIELTLGEENRFTEEAIVFAINQQMALLKPESIHEWINPYKAPSRATVGVLNAGNLPFVGLQDWLAVVLMGHVYRGVLSSKSPHLLPAFTSDVKRRCNSFDTSFCELAEMWQDADALIATGSDETISMVRATGAANGIEPNRCLFRGHRYSIAVLDGKEREEERMNLAEDVLLHEGMGCRNPAILWAPEELSPDQYLSSFAVFRGVFPAHSRTPGSLQMRKAFLEAIEMPHAYADGLEFLISKGAPEPQEPCHIRWVTYSSLDEVKSWISHQRDKIQLVLSSPRMKNPLAPEITALPFGWAQRPPLNWHPDNVDTLSFLASL